MAGRPARPRRRLVVCCDGTWNAADSRRAETNVARIARAVRAHSGDDRVPQITLYLRGVGSTGGRIQRLVAGATGAGVEDNIRSAYMFLAQNFEPAADGWPQDEIYLFGFSRGAFTARSLAGFIAACGLLKRQDLLLVAEAWDYYLSRKQRSRADFCATTGARCHEDIRIRFLGVWDTVGALGVPGTFLEGVLAGHHRCHDTTPSSILDIGRHAVAIDEHRGAFVPTLWTGQAAPGTDIRQMWFAGAHADVGGGYASRGLADIPLRWMAEEAAKAGLQLDWESGALPQPEALDALAPQHRSSEGVLYLQDRIRPTWRQMLARHPRGMGWLARAYAPADDRGVPLPVINEDIHPSVLNRRGHAVPSRNADEQAEEIAAYEPPNLRAALWA
jgi:uncharacterized protein (DUF2235 family)